MTQYDKTISQIKTDSTVIKGNLNAFDSKTPKGFLALNKALAEAEKLSQQRQKTDQSRKKTEQELNKVLIQQQKITQEQQKTQQAKLRTDKLVEQQTERTTKATVRSTKAADLLTNKYRQLTTSTNAAQLEFKQLAAEFGVGSKKAEVARKKFQKLDTKLRSINDAAKDGRRDVGRYGTALGGVGNTLKKVAGAFGIVAGFQLITSTIRDSVKIFRDFELSNSRLAGLLNTTTNGISELTVDAERLGAATAKTATEVLSLQAAYARLGFTQKEILDLTGATIDGSIALNASLEETANLTGAVVNTFDEFGTADAPKILDQLTLATQKSALNFEKLNVAIPIASGAAAAAKVPFSTFIAQLGNASDRGIEASTAATSLRNIYIELAAKGLTLEEALAKINTSQDKLTTANDLFGKRAAVTALALANTTEETGKLDEALQSAEGTASRFADETLNNLDGSVKLLSSAWEGLILSLLNTDSVFGKILRGVVDLSTAFIGFVSNSKSASDSLRQQQTLLNGYVKSAQSANVTEEQRLTIIRKIQKEYPDFLSNIDAETISNEQLNKELAKVNKQLLQKIKIQINAERLVEIETALLKIERSRQKTLEQIAKTEGKGGGLGRTNRLAKARLAEGLANEAKLLAEYNELLQTNLELQGEDQELTKKKVNNAPSTVGGVELDDSNGFEGRTSNIVRDNTLLEQQLVLRQELIDGIITESEFRILNRQIIQDQLKIDVERLELQKGFTTDESEKAEIEAEILAKKAEILAIEKETNDAITDSLEGEKKKKKAVEDTEKTRQELIKESLDLIAKTSDLYFDKREKQLEAELQQNLRNQDTLSKAIENGSKDASKSLAFEEARQEKIEANIRKNEQRRLRTEAAIALLNAYAQNGNVGETIGALSVINQAVSGLQGFYHGTDNTGSGGTMKDEHGAITGYTHENEMVLNGRETSELAKQGITKRSQIIDMAKSDMSVNSSGLLVAQANNNAALEQKLDGVIKAIKNQKMESNLYMDGSYITEQVKSDKRKDTLKRKANRFL